MLDLTGYKLTFDDEFNTRSISQTGVGTTWADIRSEWRFDANSDIGFGHSSFVDPASGYDPFKVQEGALSITAVPDRTASGYPGSWESGLITTQGDFSQTYGYFEMRADLADTKGGWDAFWLSPDTPAVNPNKLPGWQELDVIEHYGAYNQGSYRWIHTTDPEPNKNPNEALQVFSNNQTQINGFHTYGMDWQKDKISFYFDGQLMGSKQTPSDMHGSMYLLANLATQSDADEAGVPMTMKIDYIRAYSQDPGAVAVTQSAVSAPDGHDPGLYGAASAHDTTLPTLTSLNLHGTDADNFLSGGAGNDVLIGYGGKDELHGGAGNDILYGCEDSDILVGEGGNDTLYGGVGDDFLAGGDGNDVLIGEAGGDHIEGGAGADYIAGGADNDVLIGNQGADEMHGGEGADVLYGGQDNDILVGEGGDDVLYGGDGNDSLAGGEGANILIGEAGNDHLEGGTGADYLAGGSGSDVLVGGDGTDILIGGAGADYLVGEAGADQFVFATGDSTPQSTDVVADFVSGVDRLDLWQLHTNGPDSISLENHGGYSIVTVDQGADGTVEFSLQVNSYVSIFDIGF